MASMTAIRSGLQTRLKTIAGLTAYDTWPNTLNPPCVAIEPAPAEYEQTFGADYSHHAFELYVCVAATPGFPQAQTNLDKYLATTGGSSIRAAIAGDRTLGGAVDATFVKGMRDYSPQEIGPDVLVLGAIVEVETWGP